MRNNIERFLVLPFSSACASKSSVQLGATTAPTADSKGTLVKRRQAGEEKKLSRDKMKNSSGFLGLTKPNIAGGIQRLIRGFKSLSQLFFYREEDEKIEGEMEIGYPTDVKHVTHIGLNGSATTNYVEGWDSVKAPELLSLPPISFKQFELAMAAQAEHHQPLVTNPSPALG